MVVKYRKKKEETSKKKNPLQILNTQDQNLKNKDQILTVYGRHYKDLLVKRRAENMEEEEFEKTVYKKFQEIISEGKGVREIITTTKIRKVIKGM